MEIDFGTMLDDDQMEALFSTEEPEEEEKETPQEEPEKKEEKETSAEVDLESLFEEAPESVGSEDNKEKEEDTPNTKTGTSPSNIFSSIANAFVEEGIFPDLDEETVANIKSAEDFRKAINAQIKAGFDEQQQRVLDALNNNVEPSRIRQYENAIQYLDNITEEQLKKDDEDGEALRRDLLLHDYINRGFTKDRAIKAVNRAFENGTDIEDAKEALESNKVFYRDSYNNLLEEARQEKEREENENKAKAARLKKSIIEGNLSLFKDVEIDKTTRQAAYDAISKPVYKDPKTGEYYTALQKLELENNEEFLAKMGLVYALTNGFTTLDGLVKKKVKKELKKGFSELEKTLNSTHRDSFGNLRFASGVDDGASKLGKDIKFDF